VEKRGLTQNKMKTTLIAITGGIGSGKSYLLSILKKMGEQTISCDEITKWLYQTPQVIKTVGKMFPSAKKGFFKKSLDKKIISQIVFTDKQKHKELTDYLTPIILQESLSQAKKMQGRVFVEVPLLFECNAQGYFDKVIVVKRDKDARVQSVIDRSKLTEEEVLQRMNNQFDYESADLSNYIVVFNDKDEQHVIDQIKQIISG
jgi:dephospho-CoA kinase